MRSLRGYTESKRKETECANDGPEGRGGSKVREREQGDVPKGRQMDKQRDMRIRRIETRRKKPTLSENRVFESTVQASLSGHDGPPGQHAGIFIFMYCMTLGVARSFPPVLRMTDRSRTSPETGLDGRTHVSSLILLRRLCFALPSGLRLLWLCLSAGQTHVRSSQNDARIRARFVVTASQALVHASGRHGPATVAASGGGSDNLLSASSTVRAA